MENKQSTDYNNSKSLEQLKLCQVQLLPAYNATQCTKAKYCQLINKTEEKSLQEQGDYVLNAIRMDKCTIFCTCTLIHEWKYTWSSPCIKIPW